jgi:hypothetical protein
LKVEAFVWLPGFAQEHGSGGMVEVWRVLEDHPPEIEIPLVG